MEYSKNHPNEIAGVEPTIRLTQEAAQSDVDFDYVEITREAFKTSPEYFIDEIIIHVNKSNEIEMRVCPSPVQFERIRRITGYLVGTVDRFNNAKKAEEADRYKNKEY